MSVERGQAAEALAAEYVGDKGLVVVDRNWRNRWCEIDIVAKSSTGIHFVEVKYRKRSEYGTGFEYITRDKSARLQRAALAWVQAHGYNGAYQIDVVSVMGELDDPAIEYLPSAIFG